MLLRRKALGIRQCISLSYQHIVLVSIIQGVSKLNGKTSGMDSSYRQTKERV
jgi:hypothetical protein